MFLVLILSFLYLSKQAEALPLPQPEYMLINNVSMYQTSPQMPLFASVSDEKAKDGISAVDEIKDALEADLSPNHPLIAVAKCESQYRQFDKDGNVLRGIVNSKDVGVFQINEYYHEDAAAEMGLDIHTLEGNIEYAEHLYETQGLQPWSASQGCWSKNLPIS